MALKERLKELKAQNPDLEPGMVPQYNNDKAASFLAKLSGKQFKAMGLKPEEQKGQDLQDLYLNVLLLQEADANTPLGQTQRLAKETSVLEMIVRLMSNGTLPSGATMSSPPPIDAPWDTDWNQHTAPDRFFSAQTYRAWDQNQAVGAATLLLEDESINPNYARIKKIVDDLGLKPKQGMFTEQQLGKIAAEMLAQEAKTLGIEEKDVNKALHSGKFMPHLVDLKLVEVGYTDPTKEYGKELWEAQSNNFAKRFGEIDQAFIDTLDNTNRLHNNPFNPKIHQSPASYWTIPRGVTGSGLKTPYEIQREQSYLPNLAEFRDDGDKSRFSVSEPPKEEKPDPKPEEGVKSVEEQLRSRKVKIGDKEIAALTEEFDSSANPGKDQVADNMMSATGQKADEKEFEYVEGGGLGLKIPGNAA